MIKTQSNPFTMLKHFDRNVPDHIYMDNVFSPQECDLIISLFDEDNTINANVYEGTKDNLNRKKRDSQIMWIQYNQDNHWIFEKICDVVSDINMSHFRYELDGSPFKLQLTKYGPGQHFGWHRDHGPGPLSRRKLSCSVQLTHPNTYTGGELVFFRNEIVSTSMHQGSITVFPSWVSHQANKVETGTRWALVTWFEGPPLK